MEKSKTDLYEFGDLREIPSAELKKALKGYKLALSKARNRFSVLTIIDRLEEELLARREITIPAEAFKKSN